jgi:hypothetical protein
VLKVPPANEGLGAPASRRQMFAEPAGETPALPGTSVQRTNAALSKRWRSPYVGGNGTSEAFRQD